MHHLDLILTLTGVFTAALISGYPAHRLGLSPIVGYLFAGIVVSSNTRAMQRMKGWRSKWQKSV